MNGPDASGSPGRKPSSDSEPYSLDSRIQKDTIRTYTVLDTPAFRLWLSRIRDPVACLRLTGGTKASQERDIRRAQALTQRITTP